MRWLWLGILALMGCLGAAEPDVMGPARCDRPSSDARTTGCALVFGAVVSTRGDPLDGIEGSIRPGATCPCNPVTMQVDDRGLFSATVYRVGGSGAGQPDTARVTVVVQATAPKYPRHVTGAPYFDTVAVLLHFVAVGEAPVPQELRLRIPLP